MTGFAKPTFRSSLLVRLGSTIRASREEDLMVSVAELARRSELSSRFLHDVENGKANISIERLAVLARELGVSLSWLLERSEEVEHNALVALVGIRGAGKSSVGARLAEHLGVDFFELDRLVEEEAGRPLAALFEDRGEAHYHELEARVLERLAQRDTKAVLAVGGSIVEHRHNYRLLRRVARTVWLQARPKDHWERVRKQGDMRPMRGRPHALAELTALWERRKRLYQLADVVVDTSLRSVEETARTIADQLEERDGRKTTVQHSVRIR